MLAARFTNLGGILSGSVAFFEFKPSRHAIFWGYSLCVPLAMQCSGHPENILKENIFFESSQRKSRFCVKSA